MGLQLIICVETNKKCNSDFIYIRSTINRFYDVDNANIRITPVYLDGKGKYASGKVKKGIKSIERSSLMEKAFKIHCSNLCLVLDEYLK